MCRPAPEQDFKELHLVIRPLFAAAPVQSKYHQIISVALELTLFQIFS